MLIKTEYVVTEHTRSSKLGHVHTYKRKKTLLVLRCDNCGNIFKRDKGSMDPSRLTDSYYHVCSNCNAKKFAQSKGVEARKVWDMPVSSLKPISRL
jgi:rubredoxin